MPPAAPRGGLAFGCPHRSQIPYARPASSWIAASNWERLWNRVVDDTAYDWVTFHTFRKSVATLIDQTVDSKAAQAQLGHVNEDITLEHYIHKAKVAPDLTDYLERFRPPMTPKT